MNEITIHGNLTADPVLREGQSGKSFLTLTVAVNRSYYAVAPPGRRHPCQSRRRRPTSRLSSRKVATVLRAVADDLEA